MKLQKRLRQLHEMFFGHQKPEATPSKRSPSYTKKGPGRVHAGSPRRKIRGYRKHYDRNHSS